MWHYGLYSLPGSSVHGILQARVLEWVAMPSSRESFQVRDRTQVSCIAGRFFTSEPLGKPKGSPQTQGQTLIRSTMGINSQVYFFIFFTSDLNNHLIIIIFWLHEREFVFTILYRKLGGVVLCVFLCKIWKQGLILFSYNPKPFIKTLKEEALLPVWQQSYLQPMAIRAKISS